MNYYNENDPKAAAWLRELIAAGEIPMGVVDTRSITEVTPDDLQDFNQCHFFAGIGGWALALALAGVCEDHPLWTGSCPCQPFSVAGKGRGEADERHLWPVFARLIAQCGPPVVLGEQVASAAGREWLSRVRLDLEGLGYAVGAADLCAAGAGAPHIRQRLFWVADAECWTTKRRGYDMAGAPSCAQGETRERERLRDESWAGSDTCGVADTESEREGPITRSTCKGVLLSAGSGGVGDADGSGLGEQCGSEPIQPKQSAAELRGNAWDSFDLLPCTDGKTRRIERKPQQMADGVFHLLDALRDVGASEIEIQTAIETFPLVTNQTGRVMLLRGYGNAIVPQLAAQFILASLDVPQ